MLFHMTWMSSSTIRYESCPVKSVFISLFSSCLLPYEHYETCRRRMHLATAIAKKGGGGALNVQWHGKISPGLSTHALEPLFSTLIHDVRRFFFLFLLGCDVLTQPISLNSDTVHTGSHLYLGSCSEHLPRKQSTCTPRLTGSSFQGTALLFTSYPYFSHHWNWR